ncbi:MAG TPA: VOC family protein [Phnomibacter sp.]|nr:VOC family protein [Phnomibacter sp.]
MKKIMLPVLVIAASFLSGFAFKTILTTHEKNTGRVTGIGGVFFKSKDPKQLREWYHTHLGLEVNPYGSVFEWYQGADSTQKGFTQWSPFKETTTYFAPSTKDFMINYRVQNMDALLKELKQHQVTILDTVQVVDYGKFVHILDLEGNKLELWEPNDAVYEAMGKKMNMGTTK